MLLGVFLQLGALGGVDWDLHYERILLFYSLGSFKR